jgi:hypothetical protein
MKSLEFKICFDRLISCAQAKVSKGCLCSIQKAECPKGVLFEKANRMWKLLFSDNSKLMAIVERIINAFLADKQKIDSYNTVDNLTLSYIQFGSKT